MFAMERGRNRVTHWGSDSVVTLRYFSWRTNFILIRASKTEQLCSKAKRLWCVLQKNYRFNKSNTNYMMPLAPMVQELATRIRQTTSFLQMNYVHLHLHSFVSRYQFTYLDPGRSQRELTVIDQHCAIILASGSLRNVCTCRNINDKNIQRTAIFDDYRSKVTEPRKLFRLPFFLNWLGECFWHTLMITRAYYVKNLTQKSNAFVHRSNLRVRVSEHLPRSFIKGCDNGVTILPGSLPVSPG